MSSIWGTSAAQGAGSPFATTGLAPTPGGGAAARFQAMLGSSGKSHGAHGVAAGVAPGPASTTQLGLSPKAAAASSSSSSSDASDAGATITANDFLTLLVTEMQNQDPTADTDPNEYINQLVQINSLEQLISINQNLSEVLGAASSTGSGSTSSGSAGSGATASNSTAGAGTHVAAPNSAARAAARQAGPADSAGSHAAKTRGNLSIPQASPAARTVAHALNGRRNPALHGHAIRDIPTRPLP